MGVESPFIALFARAQAYISKWFKYGGSLDSSSVPWLIRTGPCSMSTANNHSPSSQRPAAQPGRAHPASPGVHLPYHSVIRRCKATGSPSMHYQQSLAQFAATGGATRPRPAATCVAGSPSTLPFSYLAPLCHQVTRDVTGFQLEIPGGREADLLARGAPTQLLKMQDIIFNILIQHHRIFFGFIYISPQLSSS